MNTTIENDSIRASVRAHYAAITEPAHIPTTGCGCSSSGCCGSAPTEALSYGERLGYSTEEIHSVPDGADLNLGCGNPFATASIQSGETVLDLGSGAGFDAFLAARKLNGTGRVVGVDMTPAMISKARANAAGSGYTNIEFRLGEIENLPVADASVDRIISNCVINLSPDKQRVFQEAYRVLKPGGRLAIADVVALAPLPDEILNDPSQYSGCVAGAALVDELRTMLETAGFEQIAITWRDGSRELINDWTPTDNAGNFVVSGIISAQKP